MTQENTAMSYLADQTKPQNTQPEQPGLISGHAEYVKGSAEVSPSRATTSSSQHCQPEYPPSLFNSSSTSCASPSPPQQQQQQQQQQQRQQYQYLSSPTSKDQLQALHQRNRQLRKIKRIRDSCGHHADVLFVANLSSCEQSVIGSITGSHAWTTSGEQDKAHAKAGLKAATEGRDTQSRGYGHVEEEAGRWTGCEGMKGEGKASAEQDRN